METLSIILFFYTLISFVFRKKIKHDTLACGLFAFVSDSPKKFSWDKFNILGLYNTTRGTDSCGRVGFGMVEKSDDKTSDYSKYISKFNPSIKGSNVVIGHTRKASVGKKNELFTQPIVICAGYEIVDQKLKTASKEYKEWIEYVRKEFGKEFPIFALAHNGTLHNYTDLLKKYKLPETFKYYSIEESTYSKRRTKKKIETEYLNDSMALTNIIYLYGHDVLSQYIGSAAILYYDMFYPSTLFAYHGESPRSSYYVNQETERPLYYYEVGNKSFYFSSIEDSLLAISDSEKKIHELPTNQVIKVEGGSMEVVAEVDRSKMYQIEYKSSGYNKSSYNNGYYWDNWGYNNHYSNKPAGKSIIKSGETPDLDTETYPSSVFNASNFKTGVVMLGFYKGKFWEYHGNNDKLKLAKGFYLVNYSGEVIKGWKNENESLPTIIPKPKNYSSYDSLYPLFIYNGVILKSYNHYVIVRDTMARLQQIKFRTKDKERVDILKGRFLASASLHPIFVENENIFANLEGVDESKLSKVGIALVESLRNNVNSYIRDLNYQYYSGSFCPLFSNRIYEVSNARLVDIKARDLKSPRTVFSRDIEGTLRGYIDDNRLLPIETRDIKSSADLLEVFSRKNPSTNTEVHQLSLPAANMEDRLKKVKYINSTGRNILLSNPIFCERCPLIVSRKDYNDVCKSCYIGQYYDGIADSLETTEDAEKFVTDMLEREVKIPDRYADLIFSVETLNSFKNVNSVTLTRLFGTGAEDKFVYSELLDPDDPLGVNLEYTYSGSDNFELSNASKSKIKKELSPLLDIIEETKTVLEGVNKKEKSEELLDMITVFEVFKEELVNFSMNHLNNNKL